MLYRGSRHLAGDLRRDRLPPPAIRRRISPASSCRQISATATSRAQTGTVEDLRREAEAYRAVFIEIRPHITPGFHRPLEALRARSLHPVHKQQTRDLVPEA